MPIFSSTVNDLQSGASFHFDGSSDYVTVSHSDHLNSTSSLTWEFWINPETTIVSSGHRGIVTKASSSREHIVVMLNTSGNIQADTSLAAFDTGLTCVGGEWTHIVLTCENLFATGQCAILVYKNGVLGYSYTPGDRTFTGSNNLKIGDTSGTVYAGSFIGSISGFKAYNRALTADEVVDAYNGQGVPYQYRGANQTELVTDGGFENYSGNNFSSWVESPYLDTISVDTTEQHSGSSCVRFETAAGGYSNVQVWQTGLTDGKMYELSFWAKTDTHPAPHDSAYTLGERLSSDSAGSWNTVSFDHTTLDTWGYYTYKFKSNNPTSPGQGNLYIGRASSYGVSAYDGSKIWIDDVSIKQIGCVAEFLPTGISADNWIDTSGNDLHGVATGAIANNYEVGAMTLENVHTTAMDFTGTADTSSVLDAYEEGHFTPVFTGSTSGTEDGYGYYTRIGNMVHVSLHHGGNIASNTLSGNVSITGLPFAPVKHKNLGLLHIRGGYNQGYGKDYTPWGVVATDSILYLHNEAVINSSTAYHNQPATYPANRIIQNGVTSVLIDWQFSYLID